MSEPSVEARPLVEELHSGAARIFGHSARRVGRRRSVKVVSAICHSGALFHCLGLSAPKTRTDFEGKSRHTANPAPESCGAGMQRRMVGRTRTPSRHPKGMAPRRDQTE